MSHDPIFQVHKLNAEGSRKAEQVASLFNNLLTSLTMVCPEKCREFSIVKTKLEEACFFAKKSIANVTENQE